MVEVEYGRGRVGSELSQWARDGLFTLMVCSRLLLVHGVCLNSPK